MGFFLESLIQKIEEEKTENFGGTEQKLEIEISQKCVKLCRLFVMINVMFW